MRIRTLLSVVFCFLFFANASATYFKFINGNPKENEQRRLILDIAVLRAQKLLEVKLPDTIVVASAEDQQVFDSLAGGKLPEWGVGAAVPGRDLILIRETMANKYPGEMSSLLQHELAHIALHHRVQGKYVPRFIDEGFASWFAGEWRFSNITTVAAAQITRSLLHLREIDDVNTFRSGKANLAYSQSYLVVLYLFERFGEIGFLELLDAFAASKNMNEAFRTALDISFWNFEYDYRKFLSERYTLFTILSDTMSFWLLLAVIVIGGYLLVRRRRKTAFDRWKEEEKLESTDFDYSGSEDDEPWKKPEDPSSPF